jgi:hypothetical protein
MEHKARRATVRLDVLGLLLAGLINTFLAVLDAALVFGPGAASSQPDLLARAAWIAGHTQRWQGGWLFWFAVTLSFAWSFYALGRHLDASRPWRDLAIGVAVIAAAVDLVGVLVNLTVLPELARALAGSASGPDPALQVVFGSVESLSNALTNVAAFGLYSFAGLLILPAAFATRTYWRWLAWLGVAEWGLGMLATVLLVAAPTLALGPMLVSFALYAPWVWGGALWLRRGRQTFVCAYGLPAT